MTTSRLLLAAALLAAVAACQIGGGETRTGGAPACLPVAAACASGSDCCSYGCLSGVCVANPVEGGACRTTNDCAAPRLCKSGACTTPTAGMCRDLADVCSFWSQCCSGDCLAGACTQNRPPVANAGPADVYNVPYTKPYTLRNASTDPDGDPLFYGWTLVSVPAGSVAALSSLTAATPTFTPDKAGAYVVHLAVTDGPLGAPNRLTSETTVTIHVDNLPPTPTASAPATQSRNVAIQITGAASDADGDALQCQWQVTPPGATAPTVLAAYAPCLNPSSSAIGYTPTGEGTYLVEYVVQDHDRTTGAVVHTVAAPATFVSHNDPPTPVPSRSPYYANMGATPATTPAVALDASASTDPNGDQLLVPGLSFFWEMITAPVATPPAITGFATATPSFVPTAEGDYVLKLTVSDQAQFGRPAASTAVQVTVKVGHYVQPLGHGVVDAARATGLDQIVLAGTDPADATKGVVWVYDVVQAKEVSTIPLVSGLTTGVPKGLDVTADGTKAVVLDTSVSIWIVTLGATPSVTRVTQPFAVDNVVVAGSRYAYVFSGPGSTIPVQELDLQTGTFGTPGGWPGYGAFGTAYHSGSSVSVYRVDDIFHSWYRSSVNNSGAQAGYAVTTAAPDCGGYPLTYATRVWATQNATFANAYVISSCGRVFRADTLAALGTTLGVYPSYVDSTAAGAVLACQLTSLTRFDAALGSPATDVLPAWSENGYGRTTFASKAFFDSTGLKRIAVVHDTATPVRYGIVTFP